ncbi:hypothetical protein AF331_17765 [Rossellomorea marisflavi]|uniref:Uncharacterized protein n=1 Tax=Rossellomorea marisflavi TaxID=189381 RepID=A0A0M0G2E5_9BACI|nr:hypothetical protein [Rossellomorea marisflavi]KON83985.1 hypothetical protein AF331_17765 [Rossellomorea marisflavi]
MQEGTCRQRQTTCKHSFSRKIDQTKRTRITPTNEEMPFTHQKQQSGMKRREPDPSGKACRKALAGSEATCKHLFSGKLDQTKMSIITPTNEEMPFTHQKPQSGMKRRGLDSCGKACR